MATSNAADLSPDSRFVSGIEPADLREEYTGRGLGDWSDARLTAAVAGIVSVRPSDRCQVGPTARWRAIRS